ncbi:MAG: hypothetical protein ACXWV1_10620 [Chitinophagaceae bacterium]
MNKSLLYIFFLLITVFSCNKKDDSSFKFILTKYDWYEYQVQEQILNNANGSWTIMKDTTYLVNTCSPKPKYRFNSDHTFSMVSACRNPQNKTGSWSLTTDNFLSGSVPLDIMGQVLHVGIEGQVTSFDVTHFNTSKTFVYNRNDNGVISKDSAIQIDTYRN